MNEIRFPKERFPYECTFTVNWTKINWPMLFNSFLINEAGWVLQSQYDKSIVSQLYRHYREQFIKKEKIK